MCETRTQGSSSNSQPLGWIMESRWDSGTRLVGEPISRPLRHAPPHRSTANPVSLRWPVHPEELARYFRLVGDSSMDAAGLPDEVRVERADDDSCVLRLFPVEPNEVFSVDGEGGPVLRGGEGEYLLVGHALAGFAGFLDGEHVMAQTTKFSLA